MPAGNIKKSKVAEVISVVAHQLRNPISVLKTYLEVLLSEDFGGLNEKQKEYLLDALENAKRMARTVSDLLDVSKIEAGKYEMKIGAVNLEKIISGVINDFGSWAKASNSKILFKYPKKIPQALADSLKIRQVVENLISNSLKYKGPGPGKIEISLAKAGKNILFSCRDNGIGIPQQDFEKVFSKFYRSEDAMEADPSGAGLGLYINKAIIELVGGKILFKPNKGRGTTFYFTLPMAK